MNPPLVVAYGMGVDSTAMLLGLHERGERPDLILFADTGSEKRETYAYLPVIQEWLRSVDFPQVIVVKYVPKKFKHTPYFTLEGNCTSNKTLPGIAFGPKSCSLKWKRAPQDKFCEKYPAFQHIFNEAMNRQHRADYRAQRRPKNPVSLACREPGTRLVKLIGYDAGPADSKRAWKLVDDDVYTYRYPLREWGWVRERCIEEIQKAGLPVPMKSACFFCPASKPAEITWLVDNHPDMADRIVEMERLARGLRPNKAGEMVSGLLKVDGLWRKGTKTRPGDMTSFIETYRKGRFANLDVE